MQNKTIKYVGFYDHETNLSEKRNFRLSATNKMDYITAVLYKNGYNVELVSPSWTLHNKKFKKKNIQINPKVKLKLFSTLPWSNGILKVISVFYSFTQLFFYLLQNTKKQDQIIVYHSKWMSIPIILLKKIKKKLVITLEVEEIYSDIRPSKFWKFIEFSLFHNMDKFIFPTELLRERINIKDKPSVIIYGEYNINKVYENRFTDGKIHVVYAGTFDPKKGGANNAIESARYLSEEYHLHIIGFGTKNEKKELLKKIKKVSEKSKAKITYDGLLKGEQYIRFLQKCHIGLSTQMIKSSYNESSFPSKILSYMANGLEVVTVRLKVVEISKIGKYVHYYNEQNPLEISKVIMSIKSKKRVNSRELINELNKNFVNNLDALLKV